MFKIILVLALISVAWCRPSYLASPVIPLHYEVQPAIIGHTVHSFPSAVSHQSQTIVHEKRPFLRPIVEHTPILKTYVAAPEIVSPYYGGWQGGYKTLYGGGSGWGQW